MRSSDYLPRWISAIFACIGGCFGCFTEPSSKGWKLMRSSFSEDFWSSSACEIEHSAVKFQRSISSISVSNQSLDPSDSTSLPSEFINHGLLLWNQTRQQWLGNKGSEKRAQFEEPTISCRWNSIYESLHENNKPLAPPVPLPEMVDFLDDVWDQEGLYD